MRKCILFIFMLSCACNVFGQKERSIKIYATIQDYILRTTIEDVKVTLLSPDSVALDSCLNDNGYITLRKLYRFNVKEGNYIIKTEKEGYETTYTPIEVSDIRRRETNRVLSTIYMKRPKVHAIDEVVVTATKVKFYNKGDTVVYNADAFQLAEGSMLDALVKQLPGVELKSDGRIYVNGRFVESLLLNGKDFFKGDNTIMLENLPTYAVNTVKVYDKAGRLSEFLGREMNDKQLVMDVNLKKQYNIGWMGNIDAGGANHDLYMARLFAMRSTDHSRISLYGNINNINDFTTPNTNDWTPDKMPYGRLTTKNAGINVNVDDREGRYEYNGSANFTHYDNNEVQNTFRTNFLSDGDTYDRHVQKARFCNMFFNTNHSLELKPKGDTSRVEYDLNLGARYSRMRHDISQTSATSDETWDGFEDFSKILSAPVLDDDLRARLINRQIKKRYYDNKQWSANIGTGMMLRMPHNSDFLYVNINGSLFGSDMRDFTHQRIDYLSGTGSTDFINRYNDVTPSRGFRINLNSYYGMVFSDRLTLYFKYNMSAGRSRSSNKLYHLETLDGWGPDTENPIGALPSVTEYLSTLDGKNSYSSVESDNSHSVAVNAFIDLWRNDKLTMRLLPELKLNILNEKLDYHRARIDTAFSRSTVMMEPSVELHLTTKDYLRGGALKYNMKSSTPNMLYSLDFVDDSDPMTTINYGNRNLKNRRSHTISLDYNDRKHTIKISPVVTFNISENDVAMGYVYDRSTGRRTYSYYNVNGNWNLDTRFTMNGPLDKKKRLYFNSSTSWRYIHSVDMIGDDLAAAPVKSTVKSSILSETLSLDWSLGKHTVGFKGSVSWVGTDGDRRDFTAINAYDYNYGLYGYLHLPFGFKLDTDLTMYSRRGYEESAMNDDNFVWNARLTRSFFKGKLTLRADAFDILHQLKKVERSINTQGRVERFYNTPPRYVLLHAIYRFNVFPKKKM